MSEAFDFPKPTYLLKNFEIGSYKDSICLDFSLGLLLLLMQ